MLAGLRARLRHFQMEEIGRSNINHFDFWIVKQGLPFGRTAFETQSFLGVLGPGLYIVGARDQARLKTAIWKTFRDLTVGATMLDTHPTHTDDTDSYTAWHS
jgi:hypothetical protein